MTDHPAEGKLLPCPFCGGKPVTERTGFSGQALYVYCINDNGCPRPKAIGETVEKAIENWNTRHSQYRELLAFAMMRGGLATGHGDAFEDLLTELEGQLKELQNRIATLRSQGANATTNGMSFGEALDLAQEGLDRWREKEHNARWWRRIDGTPIPNDLLVNIAEVFAGRVVALSRDEKHVALSSTERPGAAE